MCQVKFLGTNLFVTSQAMILVIPQGTDRVIFSDSVIV